MKAINLEAFQRLAKNRVAVEKLTHPKMVGKTLR